MPVALPMAATSELLRLQVPPVVASLNVVTELAHTAVAPLIGPIEPATFTTIVRVQPDTRV